MPTTVRGRARGGVPADGTTGCSSRDDVRTGGVHLAVRTGTNRALLNALLHEVLAHEDRVYQGWLAEHAVGMNELRKIATGCTPEWAAEMFGVDAESDRRPRPESSAMPGKVSAHPRRGPLSYRRDGHP